MKLRVVVIDDELLERERLVRLLEAAQNVEVVGVLSGDRNVIDPIRGESPDVVFLETRLNAWTGFELLGAVGPEAPPKFVFVSREREHAVRAFEVGALDYLMKPVAPERLDLALARSRAAIRGNPPRRVDDLLSRLEPLLRLRTTTTRRFLDRFPVKEGGTVYFVRVSEIDWIEAAENYIRIHTGETSHLVRRKLSQVEVELDPARFARIHRCTIVNLERVREIQPGIGRSRLVLLEDGAQLRLSERYYRPLILRARSWS